MLSLNATAEVAAMPRVRFRTGAPLFGDSPALPRDRAIRTAARCTHVSTAAVMLGAGAKVAGQVESALQQRTTDKYAYMTPIAPTGGGALGPHPARDPV